MDRRLKPLRPTVLDAGLLAAVLVTLLPWLGRWSDLADLGAQFLIQGALGVAGLLVACLLLRRRRQAALCGACLVLQLLTLRPDWLPSASRPATAAPAAAARLLVFNVWTRNEQPAELLHHITRTDPDALVLVEVFGPWREVVDGLRPSYPHRLDCLDRPGCDVVILSRQPLIDGVATRDPASGTPLVRARLGTGPDAVTVVGTHLIRPVGDGSISQQLAQVGWLADRLREIDGPVVLAGDLNGVGWGRVVRTLAVRSGLTPLPALSGTYPAWLPWPLRIPIDHALVSPELAAARRQTGPALGSDHLPVLIELPARPAA